MSIKDESKLYKKLNKLWPTCRDFVEGAGAVKEMQTEYLPARLDMDTNQYEDYLEQAEFYPATAEIAKQMEGTLFAKKPQYNDKHSVNGMAVEEFFNQLFPDQTNADVLRFVTKETITVGRVGLLLDFNNEGQVIVRKYRAENIINVGFYENKKTYVVLKEDHYKWDDTLKSYVLDPNKNEYLLYRFNDMGYVEWLRYVPKAKEYQGTEEFDVLGPFQIETAGGPIQEIPFEIITADGNEESESPPALFSLANTNRIHYNRSATLGWALKYSGSPILSLNYGTGSKPDGEQEVGPGATMTFENDISGNSKAEYVEFKGQGLEPLFKDIERMEQRMMIQGGTLLRSPPTYAESAENQMVRKEGEGFILSSIAKSISSGLSRLIETAALFSNPAYQKVGDNEKLIEMFTKTDNISYDGNILKEARESYLSGFLPYQDAVKIPMNMGLVAETRDPMEMLSEISDEQMRLGKDENITDPDDDEDE